MKLVYFLLILFFLVVASLQGAKIFLENQVATESIEVTQLKQEIAQQKEKNHHLKTQLLSYTSLETIASKAAQLGFVDKSDTISLFEPQQLAKGR